METAPLVTVRINNYNYGRYLARCIDSMLSQTHRNLEIIVYDDCSTDESGDVLNRYADRIKIIRSDMNSGRVLEGTNRMIEEAKGKYIYFYDADDWLEPDTIAESEANRIGSTDRLRVLGLLRALRRRPLDGDVAG